MPDSRRFTPRLRGGPSSATSAVLVLHGGREHGDMPTAPTQLSYVRMLDFAAGLRQASRSCAVYRLRYRVRGWNFQVDAEPDPVVDARWALQQIEERHPGRSVALLGHSMGARTAFLVADDPRVAGVCGLAPWLPESEPIGELRVQQRFVIAHGTADTMTSAPLSLAYARRLRDLGLRVARFEQTGGRHALLDRPWWWHRFAVATVLGLAGDRPIPAGVDAALRTGSDDGLRLPLEEFGKGTALH